MLPLPCYRYFVKSRLLTFALALLIGTPMCLCCVQAQAAVEKVSKSCCEGKQAKEKSQHGGKSQSCPCSASMIQRDLSNSAVDVPTSTFAAPITMALAEFVMPAIPFLSGNVTSLIDTGPAQERTPIFLRQRALLL